MRKNRYLAALFFLTLLFYPSTGETIGNPYARTNILLSVDLQKFNGSYGTPSNLTKHSYFLHQYNFVTRGSVYNNPKFMIYDTNIHLGQTLDNLSGVKTSSSVRNYDVILTLFPEFRNTMTFYAYRQINSRFSGKSIKHRFQLTTKLFTRNIPRTEFKLGRITAKTKSGNKTGTAYTNFFTLLVKKKIRNAFNELNYSYNTSDSSVGKGRDNSGLNLATYIPMTHRTSFRLKAGRSASSTASSTPDTRYSLVMSIITRPSGRSSSNHSYSFSNINSSDLESMHTTYSGALSFSTQDISSSISLSIGKKDTKSTSLESNNNFARANLNVSFNFIPHIRSYLRAGFDRYNSTSTSSFDTLLGRELYFFRLNFSTALRLIRIIDIYTTYAAGYRHEELEHVGGCDPYAFPPRPCGGSAFTNRLHVTARTTASKSGNWITKYISLSGGGGYTRKDTITGDIWSDSINFNGGISNVIFKRYLALSANINQTRTSSYNLREYTVSESRSLRASTSYILGIRMQGSLVFTEIDVPQSATTTSERLTLVARRNFNIYRTRISPSIRYSNLKYTFRDTESDYADTRVEVLFTRRLARRAALTGSYSRVLEEDSLNDDRTTTEYFASVSMGLRAWNLSLNLSRDVKETDSLLATEPWVDNKIYVTASRQFRRTLY